MNLIVKYFRRIGSWTAAIGMIWMAATTCSGQGSAPFTYQGRLNEGGAAASGNYDFQFTIFDAATGGSTIAGPLTVEPVTVTTGIFTVTLDPGVGTFNGAERWLEIAVRTSGGGSHTTLTPRQRITGVPFAHYANTSGFSSGASVTSPVAGDASLISQGLQQIASITAPSWVAGNTVNQPVGRYRHSTIWTGQEMVVWGGNSTGNFYLGSGARYQPGGDQWTIVSTVGAPIERASHSAVWTGQEMLIWGGFGTAGYLSSGGRYQRGNELWRPTSLTAVPVARSKHVAIWNGDRMIIWGGQNAAGYINDGALYNPVDDTWTALGLSNPPEARRNASAVWTGDRLLIWGGDGAAGELNSGAQLTFAGVGVPKAWQATATLNSPSSRSGHSVVWTGSRMIIWGGSSSGTLLNDGASYDPVSDVWTTISSNLAPGARNGHSAVWSGSELIVWGGEGGGGSQATGGAYDPAKDTWRTLTNGGVPVPRSGAGAVWSGSEVLVFGGLSHQVPVAILQHVNPQPTWFFYRKP